MSAVKPMRVVGWFGRILLTAGILTLAFVAYQLWGTGLNEAQAQGDLASQFDALLASEKPSPSTTVTGNPAPSTTLVPGPTTTIPPKLAKSVALATEVGQPIGRIIIPKIHVDKVFVQGVPLEQLNRAPGHYPQTPFPGQAGNAAIAGHRTTYGAPFANVNMLKPGDLIHVETLQGRFTYAVQWTKITKPDAMWVLDTAKDHPNTLTLTACHPRYDLSERYIVRAVLQGEPAPRLPGQDEVMKNFAKHSNSLADGVAAAPHPEAWRPMAITGAICAAIWLAAWWASRRWRHAELRTPPRWVRTVVPYVFGVPLFAGALFIFFENLAKVLPAGL